MMMMMMMMTMMMVVMMMRMIDYFLLFFCYQSVRWRCGPSSSGTRPRTASSSLRAIRGSCFNRRSGGGWRGAGGEGGGGFPR